MSPFYQEAVQFMVRLGVLDVVIPFIFAFTIVYALIVKTKIFGDKSSRYGAVIALVSGLVFVNFVKFSDVLLFSSYVAILLIAGLMVMLLMNFFNVESLPLKWAVTIVVVAFIIILGYDYIEWSVVWKVVFNPATLACIALIGGIWFVVREKKTEKKASKQESEFMKNFEKQQMQPAKKQEYPGEPVLLEEKKPIFKRR